MDAVWQADADINLSERDWIISVFMKMLITCVIFSHTHWLKLSAMQIKLTPVATQQTNKIVEFYSPKLKHRLPKQLCYIKGTNTKNTVKTSVLGSPHLSHPSTLSLSGIQCVFVCAWEGREKEMD